MARRGIRRILTISVYSVLLAGIVWQVVALAPYLRPSTLFPKTRTLRVSIQGDIRRPGVYRVPEGTTQFEILKVAGVRPTSDLTPFNLALQVGANSDLKVGSRDKPADVATAPAAARLEFFYGYLTVISKDGRTLPLQEGMALAEGDRIQTEAESQAEVSLGAYSRIDVDNFAEVAFDKVGASDNGKTLSEVFHKAGVAWYKIVLPEKKETVRVLTPMVIMTVGGTGADFTIDTRSDQVQVDLTDGLLLVERVDGAEAMNLVAGQSLTIYSDARPFQVTRLSTDITPSERFSQLAQEKSMSLTRSMPFNMLLCGTPAVFYAVNIQFEIGKVHLVRLPAELIVEDFAQGMTTLDQAYLYGGPVFVSAILERLLSIRMAKYCVIEKNDIVRIAGAIGGLWVSVDSKAAPVVGTGAGRQRLTDQQLVKYLSPTVSGVADSRERQTNALKALYEGMRDGSVVMTALLADQILTNIQTNLGSTEVMDQYTKFSGRRDWSFTSHDLPGSITMRKTRACLEPDLEKTRNLLIAN